LLTQAADRRLTSTEGTEMTIELRTANIRPTVSRADTIAPALGRYGLVVVIAWIGALKFTAYEAQGIQPLVANSPHMSWL
jgi:reactive chlorine resistance protein C